MSSRPLERIVWGLLFLVLAAWLALAEVFWLPLRVGGVLVPVSVLVAAVGNLLLVGWAHRLSGSRVVAVVPAAVWLTVAVTAMTRRPEGDIVLAGSGALGVLSLGFLLVGVTAAAFALARALASGPRRQDV